MAESFFRTYSKYQFVSKNTAYLHLMPRLNDFILWCKASGLHLRWEWEYTLTVYRMIAMKDIVDYRVSYEAALTELNVTHLRAAYFFWGVGISISVIVFILEYIRILFLRMVDYV